MSRLQEEYNRHLIIKKAIDAADSIILNGSDGSTEDTNRLTAELAIELMYMALIPFKTRIILYHIKKSSERSVSIKAVDAVRKIIMDSNFNSAEEANYLTSEVAREFANKALNPFHAKMIEKDIRFVSQRIEDYGR